MATLPPPVPVTAPSGSTSAILSGNSEVAAKAISAALLDQGVNLSGVEAYVLPIAELKQNLLVLDLSSTGAADASFLDTTARAFTGNPLLSAVKEANVTRLALVLRATDPSGPYTATFTVPISVLESIATGTMSQAELQKHLQIQVKR